VTVGVGVGDAVGEWLLGQAGGDGIDITHITRAPTFRMILASPGSRPSVASGSIRESMQVSTARPRRAMPVRSESANVAA
jgi:hypothetical protein